MNFLQWLRDLLRRRPAPPVVPPPDPVPPTTVSYLDFLRALNQWRAGQGRPPMVWDIRLASYASTNRGVHGDPGSMPPEGCSQCWASVGDLMQALEMWEGSPKHAAILRSGTRIGASPCPSGTTANVSA